MENETKDFWKDTRVLVTGAGSFIGSRLVNELVARGARVRAVIHSTSGRIDNLHQVECLKGDLRERDFARAAMNGIHIVFHLAAYHGGRGFINTHPADCSSNLVIDGIVFAAAAQAKVERVCFASSACVYPQTLQEMPRDGQIVYLKEEWADPFVHGRAAADREYGWAKLMGEMTLRAYRNQYGLKSVACRLFNAYGEGENETHAVIALIAKAFIRMDPYEIWGDGQQARNFTYVGDIVEGMIHAAEKIQDASAVNIGVAEPIKIIDLAKLIFKQTGFTPRSISFNASQPVGVACRAANLTHARQLLGWEPGTTLEEGMQRTIKWYYETHQVEQVVAQLGVLLTERR
jgi:nucleoside-diphosphate-sugar epimerase